MDPAPPRLVWRRSLAFLVDYLFASLLALALLWPFVGNPDRLRLGGIIYSQQCAPLTSITEEAAAVIAPDTPAAALVCQRSVLGRDNGLTLSLLYAVVKTENTESSRNVSFPIDGEGKPVQPLQPQDLLVVLILILGGGLFLKRFRMTPGKCLLGLRIAPGTSSVFLREPLRLMPLLLAAVALLIFLSLKPAQLNHLAQLPMTTFLAAVLLFTAGFLAYYLFPLIRWRGVMPWDLWTGRGPVTRK